jgi:hypothetical protein
MGNGGDVTAGQQSIASVFVAGDAVGRRAVYIELMPDDMPGLAVFGKPLNPAERKGFVLYIIFCANFLN